MDNQKLQQLESVLRRLKEVLHESKEDWNDIGSESREIKMASIIGRMQGSLKFNTSILEDLVDILNK